jgi:hypothetical protein
MGSFAVMGVECAEVKRIEVMLVVVGSKLYVGLKK